MKIDAFMHESDAIVETLRNETDPAKKIEHKRAWFAAAVACFNEEIAGDVTLVDGRVVNVPTI